MNKTKKILMVLSVFVALVVVGTLPAIAQGINDIWSNTLMHGTLTVQGATELEGATTLGGAVTASGDLTVGDDLQVTDDLTVTGFLGHALTALAMSPVGGAGAAQTITPTAAVWEITPTAAVTLNVGLVENGQILYITNEANFTILFPDSGNHLLGGARSVTQYDTLVLMQVAGKWREISVIAN
jgi:hypothetical protein